MKICIDTENAKLSFKRESIAAGIRTCKEEIIPPRSQMIIPTKLNAVGCIMTVPENYGSPLMVANIITDVNDNRAPLVVMNQSTKRLRIPADTQAAQ